MMSPDPATTSRNNEWSFLRILRTALGVLCVVLGVIGLFLPLLQGIALIALGFVLMGKKEWFGVVLSFCRRIGKKLGFNRDKTCYEDNDTEAV